MSSARSTYKTIATEIIQKIHQGDYAPGTYLPSENQLAGDFGVTRGTIRKALDILKNKGTIESFQGKGYRVNHFQWEQSLLQFYSFGRNIATEIEDPDTEVLSLKKIKGLKDVKGFVKKELWEIKRLRIMNKIPIILETSYIPVKLLPDCKADDLRMNSLYALLKENDVNIVRAKEYLEPVLPSKKDQGYLGVDNKTALFKTIRHTYNDGGELVELRESFIRGDKFRFSVELTL